MNSLFAAMQQDNSLRKLREYVSGKGQTLVYGLGNSQKHAVFAACYCDEPRPMVILVRDGAILQEWEEDLRALLPETTILELPELDSLQIRAAARSLERSARRMDALGRLVRKEPIILLASAAAAVQKSVSKSDFERMCLRISLGDVLPREKLLEHFVRLGYERTEEVEHIGEFSARGSIVDVFPINASQPFRIEFFDDEVDTVREFDVVTKRSSRNVSGISLLPLAQEGDREEVFLSYLEGDGIVVFDEPMRIREQIRSIVKETPELKKTLFRWEDLLEAAEGETVIYSALMLQQVHGAEPEHMISMTAVNVMPFQRQMDMLGNEISRWLAQKQRVLLLLEDRQKGESMRETLARRRIPSSLIPEGGELSERLVNIQTGHLKNGFEMSSARLVVVTEKDIFGHAKRRVTQKKSQGERISHFRDIKPGDYVVHVNHGIGKYLGVETLEVGGIHKDYLHIKYGGDDKLFVPTDQVNLLQKYIGSEGETPKLHRMGGTEWVKAKARAKASVEDIAQHLIEIYAKRKEAKGFAFSSDDSLQREFEDAFPYEETEDQRKAIEEIKADMEKEKPMDRLLCGDVGFGKTEVAIRAAYKAAMDGKQVAVLVPTTVLAQQHYQTFLARFMDFPPKIDVICRFRTAKEQRITLEKVEAGKVDILIGTHAILNQNRVHFKNLGLLIVDEEQRFGVKQKEKIRSLAAGIDVLTLSATPIPRTLHMSLVGARDMSIIETPPADRFPVQTYVIENNDGILASAIKREIKRGGQVYFIYNRVETIDRRWAEWGVRVAESRSMTAHRQMPEELVERVMMDFYEGRHDILLATSIVENGLDVANANTIIVYNADRFGLSQLYQMRGRVGRSHHMAFAYFVYQADKILSETAEKRLQSMKEFAELGAGFKIAMRDLEIRGAGNLLGAQQHGHIASVGFEMYCRLLEEAVEALKGGQPIQEEPPDPVIDLRAEAYIDGGYIGDAMHKIELYQRIAAIRKNEEIRDLLDELIDRFGEPTGSVMNLLAVARIKNYARKIGVKSIVEKPSMLEIVLQEQPSFDVKGMVKLEETFGRNLRMIPALHAMQFKLAPAYRKNIMAFATRVLMMLAGDENAFRSKKAKAC